MLLAQATHTPHRSAGRSRSASVTASARKHERDPSSVKSPHSVGPAQNHAHVGQSSLPRSCANMSLLSGERKHIVLCRSKIHGWGAFMGQPIAKGEFIGEYVGERISQEESDRRGCLYDALNRSYLFQLNEDMCLDAAHKGSKFKFINHAKKSNCVPRVMVVASSDHRIGFYAQRPIALGDEIVFDYNHGKEDMQGLEPSWYCALACFPEITIAVSALYVHV